MAERINVLIFPAGSENAIDIYHSLKYNIHFNVFGATSKADHAEFTYPDGKLYIGDLYITDDSFIRNFNSVIDRYGISYIIPTHDTIAVYLKENEARLKANVVCSPYETAKVAENKMLMYARLKGSEYLPRVYSSAEDIDSFPVFLKPQVGAGGKGTFIVERRKDLDWLINKYAGLLICEYLPGDEFTVDCFTDKSGRLLFYGPRKRARVNMGISVRSERVADDVGFGTIANDLNSRFHFRGAWFFQVKESVGGRLKLLEFAVRQAGTMVYFRQLGVNFAALSLFDAMGYDVRVLFNDYDLVLDRSLKNAFRFGFEYNTLYVDFDDTLIVDGRVNAGLMMLLYQCRNKGRRIVLLTKHEYNIGESLAEYSICAELFDDIIHIKPNRHKADYIAGPDSVFIDNHFPERLLVKEVCNIPVFDVDAIHCLIDPRDI